jgi:hypothetical protein
MTRKPDDFTDEMLVAFADGEADEALTLRIEAALETDEALAERLDAFVATRQILKRSFEPVSRQQVPQHLVQFVMRNGEAGTIGQTAAPAAWSQSSSWAMAAALAVAIGITGYLAGAQNGSEAGPGGAFGALAAADGALQTSLASDADGAVRPFSQSGRKGEVILRESFATRQGYCRTFAVADAASAVGGVACHAGDGWRIEVATAEGESIGGYAPASGMAKAVEAFLDAAEADQPLTSDAVKEKIAGGWK